MDPSLGEIMNERDSDENECQQQISKQLGTPTSYKRKWNNVNAQICTTKQQCKLLKETYIHKVGYLALFLVNSIQNHWSV